MSGEEVTKEIIEDLFNMLSKDGSKSINFKEFLQRFIDDSLRSYIVDKQ